MDNETTIKMPLPHGTIPNQDLVVTQEIPVLKTPFPKVQLPVPVRVPLPWHLHVDPIIGMPAPVWDDTPLFDQIYGPPQVPAPKPVRKRRYKLVVADYFLIGMGTLALAGAVGIYGFITWGWGAGEPTRRPETTKVYVAPLEPSEMPEVTVTPLRTHRPSQGLVKPPEKRVAVAPVVAPTSARPKPTPKRTVTVAKPSAKTPKPKPTPTTSASPSPSPKPSVSTSPTITPSINPGESPDG